MRTDAAKRESGQSLFRKAAANAVAQRLFGGVAITVPPSGLAGLLISMVALGGLIAVSCIVEVPQRSRAVGVLMPAGGMLDVVATRAGQIEGALVSVGEIVGKGQTLFTISDAAHQQGDSAADLRLRSLRSELNLVRKAHAGRRDIAGQTLIRLREEADTATKQLQIAKARLAAHGRQLDILESRFSRWQELLGGGHVPRDAFELEHANVVRARAESADFEQQMAAYSQSIQSLLRSQMETKKQLELDTIEQALSAERLTREIDLVQHGVMQKVSAAEQSVIVRVLAQPGDTVRSGQVLASSRRPGDRLQAWLYLPTSNARQLGVGQSVEILLDAYPHSVYGTRTAIVSSVSGTALMPADVHAPLLLAGPVFEVRAELSDNSIDADGRSWLLTPGTSFTAEIIQRRMKLYAWLFRSLRDEAGRHDG